MVLTKKAPCCIYLCCANRRVQCVYFRYTSRVRGLILTLECNAFGSSLSLDRLFHYSVLWLSCLSNPFFLLYPWLANLVYFYAYYFTTYYKISSAQNTSTTANLNLRKWYDQASLLWAIGGVGSPRTRALPDFASSPLSLPSGLWLLVNFSSPFLCFWREGLGFISLFSNCFSGYALITSLGGLH